MAQRAGATMTKLVRMFADTFGLSASDANAMAAFFQAQKLVKIDPVSGGLTITHGRLLSEDAIAALLPTARSLFSK